MFACEYRSKFTLIEDKRELRLWDFGFDNKKDNKKDENKIQ